ncbi:MAG TPA: hypothetical protein DCL38_00925 [Lachnospiraceae bacterium]|nr:hypothetical protein [Lachnospiraceae bacterium]
MMLALRNIIMGAVLIILFLMVHMLKLMRMYLVFIEKRIELKRFTPAYFGTTLINLIVPFKLGEIFRVFVFYKLTGSPETGLVGVIADRFFDTLALVLVMIPLLILYPDTLSAVSVFLAVFLIIVVFIYLIFPPTYRYLNKYIIINRTSERSMAVLRLLKGVKVWYEYVKGLVSGRYALLLLLSLSAWILEGILFGLFTALGSGGTFDARGFCEYITSILSSAPQSPMQRLYVYISIVLMAVFALLSGTFYLSRRKAKEAYGSGMAADRDKRK